MRLNRKPFWKSQMQISRQISRKERLQLIDSQGLFLRPGLNITARSGSKERVRQQWLGTFKEI